MNAFAARGRGADAIGVRQGDTILDSGLPQPGTRGLFETCGVRYVGADVLAGAITLDKEVAKRLLMQAGLPVVPYRLHRRGDSLPTC